MSRCFEVSHRFLISVMLLFFVCACFAVAEEDDLIQSPDGKGSLSGTVFPYDSDAKVYLVRQGKFTEKSIISSEPVTESGRFSFYNMPSGNYNVLVVANDSYVPASQFMEIFDDYDHVMKEINLSKWSDTGSVSGYVNPAIQGLIVHVNGGPYDMIGNDGYYRLDGLMPGSYELFIKADEKNNFNYYNQWTVEVDAGKLTGNFNLEMPQRVMGGILIGKEKMPLDEITLLDQANTITDIDNALNYISGTGNKLILDYSLVNPPDIFIEPDNLARDLSKHFNTDYPCPKENVEAGIRSNIAGLEYIRDKTTEADISGFVKVCKTNGFYSVRGVDPGEDIKECHDYLFHLLDINKEKLNPEGLIYSYDLWVNSECYIRNYFEKRYNKDTVYLYNQDFSDAIITNRNSQFLEYVRYSIIYPHGSGNMKIRNDNGTTSYLIPNQETTFPSKDELERHPENYDLNPTLTESINVPSKSMMQIIREKLGVLFGWFK